MQMCAIVDKRWGIGLGGQQPIILSADRKRFKQLTMGHAVICGRKTFETMGALPGRMVYVLTRNPNYKAKDATVVTDISQVENLPDAFVVGGGEIFHALISKCEVAYITKVVDQQYECDTFFPDLDWLPTWEISTVESLKTENGVIYQFLRYTRRK